MHAYTEVLQPSVITHSLILPVGNNNEELLFVVRGRTLLQVYDDIQSSKGPRWIAEFPLQATVTNMKGIYKKYIILTVIQAKMVILKWDNLRLRLVHKSLHFYEKLQEKSNFDIKSCRNHRTSIDERNACMLFWFQREYAAFISFRDAYDPLKVMEVPPTSETAMNAKTYIFKMKDLAEVTKTEIIEDVVLLTEYRAPTIGVLAWARPNWAGLVGAEGVYTKVFCVVTLRQIYETREVRFIHVWRVPGVPYNVYKITPLHNVPDCLAVMHNCDGLQLVTVAGEVRTIKNIAFNIDERFENCELTQIPGTKYSVVSLPSGEAAIFDPSTYENKHFPHPRLPGGRAISMCASESSMIATSRYGNAKICGWTTTKVPHRPEALDFKPESLMDLYKKIQSHPKRGYTSLDDLQEIGQLTSYGTLTSVATIDNGLACSTKDGILIVERDMPLDELCTAPLDVDVQPGHFWVVSSTKANKPLLITTKSVSEIAEGSGGSGSGGGDEEASASKRRRRRESLPKQYTKFLEVFAGGREVGGKTASNVPRGIASDQLTIAVREFETHVVVVQCKSLAIFEARSWKLWKRISIPECHFAEIQESYVLIKQVKTGESSIYSQNDLKLLRKVPEAAFTSISKDHIFHLNIDGSLLNIYDVHGKNEPVSFNICNLDKVCESLTSGDTEKALASERNGETKTELNLPKELNTPKSVVLDDGETETAIKDDEEGGENKQNEQEEVKDSQINALYGLVFNGVEYIGVHMDRIFTIYQWVGPILLKRFTMPFGVNQSPIYLPEYEMLMFPGAKSHVVVKGRQAGFNCHRVQLYDDRLIDAVTTLKSQTSAPGYEIVWLDDKETLHFVQLDPAVDHLSNTMPIRYIPLRVPNVVIKDISYAEEYAAVIVGANIEVSYTPPKPDITTEVFEEIKTTIKSTEPPLEEQDVPELMEDVGTPAKISKGRVYVLPLTTYVFQEKPAVRLEETLMCSKLVDYGTAGARQILAIGTSITTYETEETNGYIRMFKLGEKHPSSDDSIGVPTPQPQQQDQMQPVGTKKENEDVENLSNESEEDGGDDRSESDNDPQGKQDYAIITETEDDFDSPKIVIEQYAEQLVRGAVSSVCEVMGQLAVAQGQQMRVYNFHRRLDPIGFFDTSIYVTDLKAIRNILLMGEKLRGPRLVNFASNPNRLDMLAGWDTPGGGPNPNMSSDTPTVTTAVEAISSAFRGDLAVVHTEADGRFQLFQYDPENPVSDGGHKLVPLASFYTARECTSLTSAQLYSTDDIIAYGVSTDGTLFSVKPMSEEVFRTLYVLTQQMMDKEAAIAGMNPRMHRENLSQLPNHTHQIIDVGIAKCFWHLSLDRQAEYARRLGYEGLARVQRALNGEGRDVLKL